MDRGPIENPPEDTRAYFRGRCLRQYSESVAAASWDSVIFDIPGRESLQRVPTLEPLRGTRAHVGDLLDRCRTAGELVAALPARTESPGPAAPALQRSRTPGIPPHDCLRRLVAPMRDCAETAQRRR